MPRVNTDNLPRARVNPGMSEQEAGEAFTKYMEDVQNATGVSADDIDVFAGDRDWESVSTSLQETSDGDAGDEVSPSESDSEVSSRDEDEKTDGTEATEKTEETDETETDETADGQTPQVEASQLAALLGVDEDVLVVTDDGTIQLHYQVEGQRGETTLADVLKSYQLQGDITRKSQQLSEERRQMHEQMAQREHELQQAVQNVNQFEQVMLNRVSDKYSRVDWDKLRAEDPGRAAALQLEMQGEMDAIRTEVQKAQMAAGQQFEQAQLRQQHLHREWLAQQQQLMFEHLPDLADEAKRSEVLRGFQEYLTGYGFTAQELASIQDHRFMRVIADAVAYRRGGSSPPVKDASKAPELVKKRLVKVPRVAKGGSLRTEEDQRGDRRQAAQKALRKSGSDGDAARFAVESGIVDSML